MGMIFLTFKPLTVTDVKEELKGVDSAQELSKIKLQQKELLEKRNSLFKTIKNKKLLSLIELLGKSSYVETEILKNFQLSQYYFYPLLAEISKRLKLGYNEFIYCSIDEIKSALLQRDKLPSLTEIIRRDKEGFVLSVHQGTYKLEFTKKNIIENSASFVKGVCACRGVVIGRARIIFDVNEMDKVQKGDILITGMTTPNFVLAMKRAGAIVTNDGGITCHAAIVSRELGKPCVIATKNATEVFKDGDLVEVDANSGVVKKV